MITTENSALVVIDVQEKLTAVMNGREGFVKAAVMLAEGAGILGLPVINCRQYPERLGDTISELREKIDPFAQIDKKCFSAYKSEQFVTALKDSGADYCIICGIESHICVCQTVIDLIRNNYKCYVVAEAVSSRAAENTEIALQRMRQCGAQIVSAEMVLFEMLESSEHHGFKDISKLIR
ncbi:MAG: isochorismatase family protein [Phycisphaerae bacterium]